jgi:hypothetical protein
MWISIFLYYLFIYCFLQYWGVNSGPHVCQAYALPLEPLHQLCFVLHILEIGFYELLAKLALNHNPPDLYLLSS